MKKRLEAGEIEMGHARTLLRLPAEKQPGAAAKVIAAGLSVRRTELLVERLLAGGDGDGGSGGTSLAGTAKDPDVLRLESDLSARIGARVSIRHSAKKGQVVIHYHSLDELDGILARIK